MKSVCIEEIGKVVIKEDQEKPVPKEGEALLKLLYGGICGSDLSSYRGKSPYVSYPRTPGHEFSAEIVEVGPNAYGLKPGMIVTCNPYFNCGTCYSCRRGRVNCCMTNQTMGVQREGAFSDYITMPVERIYDGKGLDPKILTLIEPFCISYHGVKQAKVKAGDRVLVVGAGTIGVLAAVAAKMLGAEVTICDVAEGKCKYAVEKFGIDHMIVNTDHDAFMAAVDELTNKEGFEATIEAVGLPSTFINCVEAAAVGGKMAQVGLGNRNADFMFTMIQKRELELYGSRNALKEDFLQLIDLVSSGKVDLTPIISKEYKYTDAAQAFKDMDENSGSVLKLVLKFTE